MSSVEERKVDRAYEGATQAQRDAYWAAIEAARKAFDKAEKAAFKILTKS